MKMKKSIIAISILSGFLLSACSAVPPKPAMPRGPWVQMNTGVLAEMEAKKE